MELKELRNCKPHLSPFRHSEQPFSNNGGRRGGSRRADAPTSRRRGGVIINSLLAHHLAAIAASQRTRDAVACRLVETLTSPSVLSKRYGVVPLYEAASAFARIEEEAFSAASTGDAVVASVDHGIDALQIYSKEVSIRVLEFAKARAPAESGLAASETNPLAEPSPSAA